MVSELKNYIRQAGLNIDSAYKLVENLGKKGTLLDFANLIEELKAKLCRANTQWAQISTLMHQIEAFEEKLANVDALVDMAKKSIEDLLIEKEKLIKIGPVA